MSDELKSAAWKWLKPHLPKNLIGWLLAVLMAMMLLLCVFVLVFRQILHFGNDFPIYVSSSSESAVPVGGVIMWWGDWSNIKTRPKGFDLCDGGEIRDAESQLNGKYRPDLLGRYPKGAPKHSADVVSKPTYGGFKPGEEIFTEGTRLTMLQIPKHSHKVIEPNGGKGHYHNNTEDFIFTGGGGGTRLIIPNARRGAGGAPQIPQEEMHGLMGNDPRIVEPSVTGIKLEEIGADEAHAHKIVLEKIEPAHLQIHFLIRFK